MAQRRMFSLQIVDTDAFMDMPLSAQALYFHLGMRADDDGFVSNARRIQKLVGAADDDMKLLIMKRFILVFDSGVIVIKHWKISNYIQKDRYRPTLYKEEKGTLYLKPDGAYTDHPGEGYRPCLQAAPKDGEELGNPEVAEGSGPVSIMDTDRIHRLGKGRLGEERLGKGRLGEDNILFYGGGDARATAESIVAEYMSSRDLDAGIYFGVTERELAAVAAYADAIFARFTKRTPNDTDRANVFQAIRHSEMDEQTKEWTVTFPQERIELLMYAFEQAAIAGRPGEWRYIDGVLAKLSQRGIKTIDEAEDYDFEREANKGAF